MILRSVRLLVALLLVVLSPVVAPRTSAAPGPSGALVLRLELAATVEGTLVRLRDVASSIQDPQRVWPEVADLVVGSGSVRWVTRGKVLNRLEGAGVPTSHVELEGPGMCMLEKGEVAR